jgi:hypothetical protein
LKNHYGTCRYPDNLHAGFCDPYIPALNALSPIRDKQVLCICDALFGIVSRGPTGPPQIVPKSLIFSTNPVAHDSVGRQMLLDAGCPTTSMASYISTASQSPYNLGVSDLNQIELISMENPTTGIEEDDRHDVPSRFMPLHNYPNPFNARTTIAYRLAEPARVRLDVYSLTGRLVRRLVDKTQERGVYRVLWDGVSRDGTSVSSGTYLAGLHLNGVRHTIRMQLIR